MDGMVETGPQFLAGWEANRRALHHTVVWAIRDGRDAAARMHEWIGQQAMAVAAE